MRQAPLAVFLELRNLKAKDSETQLRGPSTTFAGSFYHNRLGLTTLQSANVDFIVSDCFNQIAPLDQQVKTVITEYRSHIPNGKLKEIPRTAAEENGLQAPIAASNIEKLPPIPAELTQLQTQKNQIILSAKARIKTALGVSNFAKFDAAIRETAGRILVPVNSYSAHPQPNQTPSLTPGN